MDLQTTQHHRPAPPAAQHKKLRRSVSRQRGERRSTNRNQQTLLKTPTCLERPLRLPVLGQTPPHHRSVPQSNHERPGYKTCAPGLSRIWCCSAVALERAFKESFANESLMKNARGTRLCIEQRSPRTRRCRSGPWMNWCRRVQHKPMLPAAHTVRFHSPVQLHTPNRQKRPVTPVLREL